jgi:hypothetical protein
LEDCRKMTNSQVCTFLLTKGIMKIDRILEYHKMTILLLQLMAMYIGVLKPCVCIIDAGQLAAFCV